MSNIDTLKTDLVYFPLKLSRNKLTHTIQEADPATYLNRAEIEYSLEISKPEFLGSDNYVAYPLLRRKEKPPYNQVGITIYEGATFSQIQNLLDSSLTRKKPNYQQNAMSVAWGMTSNYKLREIIEVNNVDFSEKVTDVSLNVLQIIKSGISELDYKLYGDSFYSKVWAGKFLTFQLNNKVIGKTSEEYLYFLTNFIPLPLELHLRVRCLKKDGTTEIITPLISDNIHSIPMYQVVCIPVGFTQLNLSADTIQYEVWVSNENDERISEVRTYLVDSFYQHQERNLLINNSLGTFDTIRLLGESMRQLKVVRNIIEVDAENTVELAELQVVSVKGNRSLTISTGYIKKNTINSLKYLSELMLAEDIFEITEKGHIPMMLDTTEYIDSKDNPELTSVRLTFRYTITERNFSELPNLTPQPTRPTSWRNYGDFTCELDAFYRRTGNAAYARIELYYLDTNEAVRPRQIKLNLSDDPDYVQPVPSDSCVPRFLSDEQSMICSYKKNSCNQPYLGTAPTITIAAGRWGSESSKEEANQRAIAEMNLLNTQTYANTFGSCEIGLYVNTLINRKGSYKRQGCPTDLHGTKAQIVINSGSFSSNLSQSAAQGLAEEHFSQLDTQTYANEFGNCEILTFYNAEIARLGTYKRTNCQNGYVGGEATITILEGEFISMVSQEDADSQAEMSYLQINSQAHADEFGTCTLATPGIFGRFFDHPLSNTIDLTIFEGTPSYERIDSRIDHGNGNSIQFPSPGSTGHDYYGIHFNGVIKSPISGILTVYVTIQDANEWFKLHIDNDILEKPNNSLTTLSINLTVTENEYLPIDLKYIELAGFDGIRLSWSYSGQAQIIIPDSAYSHV